MPDNPYRHAIAVRPPTLVPAAPRRPVRWWWWYLALPLSGVAVMTALGAGAIGLGVLGYAVIGMEVHRRRRRRVAQATLRGLPFPVTHAPPSADDIDRWARPIIGVEVRLGRSVDDVTAQRMCDAAGAAVPGARVERLGDSILVSDWPWGRQDLVLLAYLLSTWGLAVHAECEIVAVAVTWPKEDGPPMSL